MSEEAHNHRVPVGCHLLVVARNCEVSQVGSLLEPAHNPGVSQVGSLLEVAHNHQVPESYLLLGVAHNQEEVEVGSLLEGGRVSGGGDSRDWCGGWDTNVGQE